LDPGGSATIQNIGAGRSGGREPLHRAAGQTIRDERSILVGTSPRAERARIEERVIKHLSNLRPTRRHPRPVALSRYLDGDLDVGQRSWIEAHVRGCPRCRRRLASLADTIKALGSIATDQPDGLADSIIAALRNEDAPDSASAAGIPARSGKPELTVLHGAAEPPLGDDVGSLPPGRLRTTLLYCLSWSQLRLTMPIAVAAGVVLTVVNMGGTMTAGRIDLGVCLMCATDFLVPFLAVNLVLIMLMWAPARSRPQSRGHRPA
jgi:hypothetical protein